MWCMLTFIYKVIGFLEHPSSTSLFDVCIFNHLAAENCQWLLHTIRLTFLLASDLMIVGASEVYEQYVHKIEHGSLPPALGMSRPTEHYIAISSLLSTETLCCAPSQSRKI